MARPPARDRPAGGERLWRIDIDGGKITGYDVVGAAALADSRASWKLIPISETRAAAWAPRALHQLVRAP